jgi:hypothetical protein
VGGTGGSPSLTVPEILEFRLYYYSTITFNLWIGRTFALDKREASRPIVAQGERHKSQTLLWFTYGISSRLTRDGNMHHT